MLAAEPEGPFRLSEVTGTMHWASFSRAMPTIEWRVKATLGVGTARHSASL